MPTILLYEEDDQMRGLLTEWLRGCGYQVRSVAMDGSPSQNMPNLVIASLYNPKQAGTRLINDIQAKYPGIPVIAISAQFRAGLSTAGTTAQSLGVAQVIAKPLTRDALLGAVKSIFRPEV